jgi:hypothetical protein
MLATAALALQAPPANLPQNTNASYSGAPGFARAGQEAQVRMVSHSVTTRMTGSTLTTETVSVFRNQRNAPASITIQIPEFSQSTAGNRIEPQGRLTATWDHNPLRLQRQSTGREVAPRLHRQTGQPEWSRHSFLHTVRVDLVANGTHALRTVYTAPEGTGGLDGALKVHAYDLARLGDWAGNLERLNFSFQDPQQRIFSVERSRPNYNWQIGPRGAFFRRDNFTATGSPLVVLAYYVRDFDQRLDARPGG